MPFGLKSAPATFCKMMSSVLGHLSPTQVVLYMDDLCVVSKTFETHLKHLELIFDTLLWNGLRINAKKCELGMNQVLWFSNNSRGYKSKRGEN